jgi:ubiquinone/menaquinone biosynthesis C-methylase UbiE
MGGVYQGVDVSQDMIELARAKDPKSDFRVADARDLPYPPSTFDLVITVKFLKWIPDDASLSSILREVARVLKPGGLAILHQKVSKGISGRFGRLAFALAKRAAGLRRPNEGRNVATRALGEAAFLRMCREADLRLRFVIKSSPLLQRHGSTLAFYSVEKAS